MRRFILFLVRKKFGLKKRQCFCFTNQKTPALYFFTNEKIMRYEGGILEPSGVSLNWLLDKDCVIEKKDGQIWV